MSWKRSRTNNNALWWAVALSLLEWNPKKYWSVGSTCSIERLLHKEYRLVRRIEWKGDQCVFRHEPSALGCETVCPFWLQRKCDNRFCSLRHMELKKNRKLIPCYWENQPGGCRKPHCPFLHKHPRDHQVVEVDKKESEQQVSSSQTPLDRGDWSRGSFEQSQGPIQVASDGDTTRMGPRRISQGSVTPGSVPDPLVVSFDDGMRLY